MNVAAKLDISRPDTLVRYVLFGISYPVLYVGAFVPWPIVFAAGLVAVLVAELWGIQQTPLTIALRRVHLGTVPRSIIRDAAVLVLIARSGEYDVARLGLLTMAIPSLYLLRGIFTALLRLLNQRRQLPHSTRNLDLSRLRIPDAPPAWLRVGAPTQLTQVVVPLAVGVVIDAAAGTNYFAVLGLAVSALYTLGMLAVVAVHYRRNRVLGDRDEVRAEVLRQVRAYQPEVMLYFSLGEASGTSYQVDSWLTTLAELRHKAMILVREHKHVPRIGPTDLPIISMPRGPEVMDLDLPDLKVVMYVGNVGNNLHMLRHNGIRHIFVGHGDSDKVASTNPASRVYDEVWVAGRAGRDRYRRAGGAVSDASIVEVGRPQLAALEPPRQDRRIFTVLYAPTWEGWSNDLALSSVPVMGVKIVKTLLALSPNVRIIYKPHPLTGYQDKTTRRINQQIIDMLETANKLRAADPAWTKIVAANAAERTASKGRLTELQRLIDQLSGSQGPDSAQTARDNGIPDPERHAKLLKAEQDWQRAHWDAAGWWAHRTVTGPRPDLYSCFNEADMMIADISAVVSDFVGSGKPYVVTNIYNQDESAFRTAQTVAGGAYLLGSKAEGLSDLVQKLQRPEPVDPMAERREALRHYLLGPDEPDPLTRFNDALDNLIAKPYPVAAPMEPLEAVAKVAAAQSGDGEPVSVTS
uniref:CDP-glycerol glycerophosphotransferase family protein n=1 Tax=Paractinoplanes polyasparticus TaxID=2856853 RepID=UPI001C85337A|nr:CDP-glycerol glycerophosphotransferase family protein [Actinoplanes polyasparticus]